jgi:hypothetical protein
LVPAGQPGPSAARCLRRAPESSDFDAMRANVYLVRVRDATGKELDATYSVLSDGDRLALIMESRSGRSSTSPGRNSDYNVGLTTLLERLGRLNARLVDAFVDSRKTQTLGIPEADRLIVRGPVRLAEVPDMESLRVQMGTAQAKVAQEPDATKGGNSTKRIRLRLDVPGFGPDQAEALATTISAPAEILVTPGNVLERLARVADGSPSEADYARLIAELDGDLDRVIQMVLRIEQAYLRKALFPGPTAKCDLCGRTFDLDFLVAAHIKRRASCTQEEKRDVPNVVMSACRFGCDELFERGYISVDEDGHLIRSTALDFSEHARAYVREHLADRSFGRPMLGREAYFRWHRLNRLRRAAF